MYEVYKVLPFFLELYLHLKAYHVDDCHYEY